MHSPIWISHRGFCRDSTENTAEAFRAAIALGFDHLETDLRTTADGQLVLSHDPGLERTGNTRHLIGQSTRLELEKIRLQNGERLVFFEEFLDTFSDKSWIFDVKPEQGNQTVEQICRWWDRPQWQLFFEHRVRFLFWNIEHQNFLLSQRLQAVCMARMGECRRAGISCLLGLPALSGIRAGCCYALPPKFAGIRVLRRVIVHQYQKRRANVLAYLPENEAAARLALKVGVDEILTNDIPIRGA